MMFSVSWMLLGLHCLRWQTRSSLRLNDGLDHCGHVGLNHLAVVLGQTCVPTLSSHRRALKDLFACASPHLIIGPKVAGL